MCSLECKKASIVIQLKWQSFLAKYTVPPPPIIEKIACGAIQRPKYWQALKETKEQV